MYLIISTDKNNLFSVARADKNGLKVVTINKPFKQTELLLRNIAKLVDIKKTKGIVVNQGPGEFSALRIGVATANALSFALAVPIIGVCLKKDTEWSEKDKIEYLWRQGENKLNKNLKTKKIILPYYDKEPNITIKK